MKFQFTYIILIILNAIFPALSQTDFSEYKPPPQFRLIRAYGADNEKKPPVVVIDAGKSAYSAAYAESSVTIEFDVACEIPPSLVVKFVHCSYDWIEDENIFLQDIVNLRTTLIDWESAPISSTYYQYRGKISVPNSQVKFNFAGNWKAKFYEMGNENAPLAESRFFVVKPKAECSINMISDFYSPLFGVSSSAFSIEALVTTREALLDNNLHSAALYLNHRWNEPYYITENPLPDDYYKKYKYHFNTLVGGFARTGKLFRIDNIPAENAYRVLYLTNLAEYPRINGPVRMTFSDQRRNGTYWDYDEDGAMTSDFVSAGNDEYIYLEFLLSPEGWLSKEDVFAVGSFNSWTPSPAWQMYFDEEDGYYHLRQWVRRAKHNYLYATGRINHDKGTVEKISYDQYEGNTVYSNHTYLLFVYYREIEYGGYDAIIAVAAASYFGGR
jgi:hypothetical protein